VEAELTDWLSEEITHGDSKRRKKALELLSDYEQVVLKVVGGKYTKLCGPEADIDRLEADLMRTFADDVDAVAMETDAEQPRDPRDGFVYEMDVKEYTWHYLLFKHADLLSDLASKHGCGVGVKPSLDSHGRVQSMIQVSAPSQARLEAAVDEMVSLLQVLTEDDIQRRQVDLHWKECFSKLEEQLKKRDILLILSPCYVVGPASALEAAQSIVAAAVNKNDARKLSPVAVSVDDSKRDVYSFHIPVVGLTVHVHQGM